IESRHTLTQSLIFMADQLHVLQIEDSPTIVQLTRSMLAESKSVAFVVEAESSLAAGIKRLARGGIDVVLLDLTLPDSEGLETFSTLQAVIPKVPIVIFTSVDDEELTLDALRQGAADYLVKSEVHAKWLARALSFAPNRNQTPKFDGKSSKSDDKVVERSIEIEKSDATPGLFWVRINAKRMVSVVTMEVIKNRMLNLVKRTDVSEVRVDFSNVEYVANAAISMLLIVHKKAKAADAELILCNISNQVFEQFTSRRFDKVFRIERASA
ncbi:MAG TPA: response regulator, partial [Pirellulaceae bacterium]|nr:response regulator [Pirellulaceae bacterium]